MNAVGKKCLALIIALMTVAGAAACVRSQADPPAATPVLIKPSTHPSVRFEDMEFVRPDVEQIRTRIAALYNGISLSTAIEQLLAEYRTVLELYDAASCMTELAYLRYAMDVTDATWQETYSSLQAEMTSLDFDIADVSIALFQSSAETEKAARAAFGNAFVDAVYSDDALNVSAIESDLDAEKALTQKYDVLQSTFTYYADGREWTLDEIINDPSLGYEEFYQLYDGYSAAFNSAAGSIFSEQLIVRKRIAETLGYGSYAAYRYDWYGRDYSVTDAKNLHAAVKQYIVPAYIAANSGDDDEVIDLYSLRITHETFLAQFAEALADFAPEAGEAFHYMRKNNLFDSSVSDKKMSVNFTTYLSTFQAPFTLSQWQGDIGSVSTAIHEFGHFLNYYSNPVSGWMTGDSLDLAEIDSQATQLLMTKYNDVFFGQLSRAATKSLLLDCMYTLITGCMEDEFQQAVYANPDWKLPDMNACYKQLADEYGLTELYGYTGTEWTQISHTYQTPMYYISYAVSMVPALELWAMAQTDYDAAKAIYFNILHRAPYAEFRSVLAENGLSDVFSEDTIVWIAKLLEENT